MITIACGNLKGGVGKTTCAVNVGAGLSRLGWRVLLVDADPQAHLTASLGLAASAEGGLAGMLAGRAFAESVSTCGDMDVVLGSPALAGLEMAAAARPLAWQQLMEAGRSMAAYDVMLLDCSPHWGLLTRGAMGLADGILVPMNPDFLALQSLAWFCGALREIGTPEHPTPPVIGIVLNRFSPRKRLHREVLSAVRGHFPELVCSTRIRDNIALAEAPSHGQDIFAYAPQSAGARDFGALCRELAARARAIFPHAPDLPGQRRSRP